jgi:hypothetical protein
MAKYGGKKEAKGQTSHGSGRICVKAPNWDGKKQGPSSKGGGFGPK